MISNTIVRRTNAPVERSTGPVVDCDCQFCTGRAGRSDFDPVTLLFGSLICALVGLAMVFGDGGWM